MAGPVGKKRFRVSSSVVGAAGALEQQNLPLLWKDRSGGGGSGSRVVAEEGGAGRGGFPCAPTAELTTAQWTKCGLREEERNYRRCRQPCRALAGRPSEVTDLHLGQVAAGG